MWHLALLRDHPARLLLLQFCVHEMVNGMLVFARLSLGTQGTQGGKKGHALLMCVGSIVTVSFSPRERAVEIRQSRVYGVPVNARAVWCEGLRCQASLTIVVFSNGSPTLRVLQRSRTAFKGFPGLEGAWTGKTNMHWTVC